MGLKALELAHDPSPELPVDVVSQSRKGRTAEPAVIGYPSPKERIELFGDFSQRPRRLPRYVQAFDRRSHRFQCRGAGRRRVATEELVSLCLRHPSRPELIPEEVEHDIRVFAPAPLVLAIDDLGLCRMHLKSACCQSSTKLRLEGFGLLFTPAVHKAIVSISTPWKLGMRPRHPQIKCIVHKEIRLV